MIPIENMFLENMVFGAQNLSIACNGVTMYKISFSTMSRFPISFCGELRNWQTGEWTDGRTDGRTGDLKGLRKKGQKD